VQAVQARRLAWGGERAGALLADGARIERPTDALFDPVQYGARATPVAVGGRQAAWFVSADFGNGVLRHYRRGGLVARINRRAYFWHGEARTRSFAEFRLLADMYAAGLPVPRPLAAAYWRRGLVYRAAILIERIEGVRTLAHCLREPVAQAVAQAIAAMHRHGIWHADLNAFNILIDGAGAAWLIDFDRGSKGALTPARRQANLLRLRRSLQKVAGADGEVFWQRIDDAYDRVWSSTSAL
jgi:3-deoxy-D-manno-octulosonic acid kinase